MFIAETLRRNHHCVRVNVRKNSGHAAGVSAILAAAESHPSLTSLNIGFNGIGSDTYPAAFVDNLGICGPTIMPALQQCLETTTSLRELFVAGNNLTVSDVTRIAEILIAARPRCRLAAKRALEAAIAAGRAKPRERLKGARLVKGKNWVPGDTSSWSLEPEEPDEPPDDDTFPLRILQLHAVRHDLPTLLGGFKASQPRLRFKHGQFNVLDLALLTPMLPLNHTLQDIE